MTCAVRAVGTVRPGAHEAKRWVLASRVLVDPRASAADGDDVAGEIGPVASRPRFQVAKLLHALVAVVPAEEGDDGALSVDAQLLQHLWRDRLTQDHAVEPRAHPGGRAAAWRTGHEAERYGKKKRRHHGMFRVVEMFGGGASTFPHLPFCEGPSIAELRSVASRVHVKPNNLILFYLYRTQSGSRWHVVQLVQRGGQQLLLEEHEPQRRELHAAQRTTALVQLRLVLRE